MFSAVIVLLIIVFSNIGSIAHAEEQCNDTGLLEGEWHVVEENDGTECDEGISIETYDVTVSIDGCNVTYQDSCGEYTGTINGGVLDLTGECYEDGGVSVIQGGGYIISEGMVEGSTTWIWSDGYFSCSGTSTFTANVAPQATLISPSDGDIFAKDDIITFEGLSADFEEGTLVSNSLVWTSNIDGKIGIDGSFTRNLSPGVHIINFTVTDNGLPGIEDSQMSDVESITLALSSGIGTGFIVGTVYDSTEVDTPIVGANIVSNFGGAAISIDGGYYFMELSSGKYTITCSYDGYQDTIIENVRVGSSGIETIDITMSPYSIASDIKANGSEGPVTINTGDQLRIAISLNPGSYSGTLADWYIIVNTPSGWMSFNVPQMDYSTSGISALLQGYGLIGFGSAEIFSTSSLNAGTYTYYFAVYMNGQLYYDRVVVNVR